MLIWRLNNEKAPKFWQGRSICPKCKHQLNWQDNIPLLSFVLLNGKCRYCHKKISWQYPIVEIITAISFLTVNPYLIIILCCLIVIFFSDLIYGLIPDEIVLILGVLGILGKFGNVVWGLAAGGIFYLIYFLTKGRGMGFGDVKLAAVMGLLLGWPKILVALYSAFVLGGIVAIFLLLLKRKRFGETIALGPFLCIGVILSLSWLW